MLVGNKSDDNDKREVNTSTGEALQVIQKMWKNCTIFLFSFQKSCLTLSNEKKIFQLKMYTKCHCRQ